MGVFSAVHRAFRRRSPRDVTPPPLPPQRVIHASYDAARDGNETVNIWLNADAYDADTSNSLVVRSKLRRRSRYERANNGDACGVNRTDSCYVIGIGPMLRMKTGSKGMNRMVEARWKDWSKAVKFNRKLRTARKAKETDGEVFLQFFFNPNLKGAVKLDFRVLECDRVTAPVMTPMSERYIDGARFDEYGNPESYDVLRSHPGSAFYAPTGRQDYDTVPAKWMCHWYGEDRPEQHRGVPTGSSTLNLYATGRRYREAVLAAAETAADFSVLLEMGEAESGPDVAAPFTSLPIDKRMITALPGGSKASQMRAEHPSTTYEGFTRSIKSDAARPHSQPFNIAAADSSGYSFSGGKLDHHTFYVFVSVERQECEDLVLDFAFPLWFEEAVGVYGWTFDREPAPRHEWGWPAMPKIDDVKVSNSRKTDLASGVGSLGRFYQEDGQDYEDQVEVMAQEYGISVDEMKLRLLAANFPKGAAAEDPPDPDEDPDAQTDGPPARANANGNGHNRLAGILP